MQIKRLTFSTVLALAITGYPVIASCQSIDHKLTGDHYLKKGLFASAIAEYKEAITTNPSSTAIYFDLAIAYYSARNIDDATFALTKVIELNPNDVEAIYNLACLKLYQRNIKAATLHFEEAKRCCAITSEFAPLIQNGLDFIDQLKSFDPQTQDKLFYLLLQALPAQGLTQTAILPSTHPT